MNRSHTLLASIALLLVALPHYSSAVEELPSDKLVVMKGMTDTVRKLAWQPGGGLVSGDANGNLALWDVTKSKMVNFRSLLGETGFVRELGLFQDGSRFFVAFNSKVLTGSLPMMTVDEPPILTYVKGSPLWRAAVSPDEKWIAVGAVPTNVVVVSVADRKVVAEMEPADGVAGLIFLPDGRLAVASRQRPGVAIYVVGQSSPSLTLPFSAGLFHLAISPDGTKLACASQSVLEVCEIKEGATRLRLGKSVENSGIAWTPDGSLLAASTSTGQVRFWDPQTGELKKQLTLQEGQASCIAFSPDGTWLAIGSGSYTIPNSKPVQIIKGDNAVRLLRLNDAPAPGSNGTPPNTTHTWTSRDGKTISASLVAVTGTDAVLKMSDGKEYRVAKDRLSDEDRAFIDDQIKKRPILLSSRVANSPSVVAAAPNGYSGQQNYRFNVSWSKDQVSVAPKFFARGYDAKVTTWKPKFKVTNTSGKEVTGLTLLYQLQIKRDRDTAQNDHDYPSGTLTLPAIKHNQTIEVEGKPFETLTARLNDNFITTDGSRANKSDDVQGALAKVLLGKTILHEWKSGTGVKDKIGEKLKEAGLIEKKK